MASLKEVISNLAGIGQNKETKNKWPNGIVQFEINGDDPTVFFAKFEDGYLSGGQGVIDHPNITVTMTSQDFKDLLEGKLDGMAAFAGGRIKIRGDMYLAMILAKMLRTT